VELVNMAVITITAMLMCMFVLPKSQQNIL